MTTPTKSCRLCGFDFPCADPNDSKRPGMATVCPSCSERQAAADHPGLRKTAYPGLKRLICPYCAAVSEVNGVAIDELWYYGMDCPRCSNHSSLTFLLWRKLSFEQETTGKKEARKSFYE